MESRRELQRRSQDQDDEADRHIDGGSLCSVGGPLYVKRLCGAAPTCFVRDTQNNSPQRGDFLVNEDVVSHVGSATPRSRAISKPPHVHPALLELTVNSHIKFSSCAVSTFHKYRYRFPKGVRLRAQVAPRPPARLPTTVTYARCMGDLRPIAAQTNIGWQCS